MLLERSHELDVLRAAIADARAGAGRLVMIEGPAGIGKTALLAQAREAASEAGLQVLSARGHELEPEFAFGAARQLFELPVARADAARQDQLLAGAAGLTRPLLRHDRRRDEYIEASDIARPAPDIGFTISHGFYWLTANIAETGPLLLALDDAQFADRSSLQCISYLAARCQELPVLLALTVRSDEWGAAEEPLSALRTAADTTIVTPAVLSEDAVAQVVRGRLGEDADPRFCSACDHVSGGNPFLLGELLTELAAERVPPIDANAARVELASPESVGRGGAAQVGTTRAGRGWAGACGGDPRARDPARRGRARASGAGVRGCGRGSGVISACAQGVGASGVATACAYSAASFRSEEDRGRRSAGAHRGASA